MRTDIENLMLAFSEYIYAEEVMGTVEDFVGYNALVDVPDPWEQELYMAQTFGDDVTETLEKGWWIINIDSQGFVCGERFESESDAYQAWSDIEAEYIEFDSWKDEDLV